MISSALAFVLVMTAAAADGTPAARKAYSACLEKFMAKGLDAQMEPEAFDAAVATACPAEASRLRQAAIDANVAAGRKRADAEDMVAGDIEDYQLNTKELYREFKETGARPTA